MTKPYDYRFFTSWCIWPRRFGREIFWLEKVRVSQQYMPVANGYGYWATRTIQRL